MADPPPDSPLGARGYLPPGIHRMTGRQFAAIVAHNAHRRELWERLEQAADDLRVAGIDRIYIGGSYVTAEEHPRDIDGYWIVPRGEAGPKGDPAPCRDRSGINLFPDVLGTWERFLSTNRDGEEVGIVELRT